MSVMGIIQVLTQSLNSSGFKASFKTDANFDKPLNIGQVIKGKVLRHYEGSHYLVSFSGEEKVVDSTVPLKTGELIHGRIVGVDEKVHMKRILVNNQQDNNNNLQVDQGARQIGSNRNEQFLLDLFQQYQGKLSQNDLINIVKAMVASKSPVTYALSSLVLSKLGLPQSTELLSAISKVLEPKHEKGERTNPLDPVMQIGSDPSRILKDSVESIKEIGEWVSFNVTKNELLQKDAQESHASNSRTDQSGTEKVGGNANFNSQSGGQKEHDQWKLGTWLLNVQTDSSVAHKILTLPFLLGGKLVEINVALFSERQAANSNSNGYKRIILSLSTESLGNVAIDVKIRENQLKLNFTSGDEQGIDSIAQYLSELKSVLRENGWEIEEIKYGYSEIANNQAIHSIVEHHVTKDSVNQLI